jgi:adenine deaminase
MSCKECFVLNSKACAFIIIVTALLAKEITCHQGMASPQVVDAGHLHIYFEYAVASNQRKVIISLGGLTTICKSSMLRNATQGLELAAHVNGAMNPWFP